jgi:hypothetical protein
MEVVEGNCEVTRIVFGGGDVLTHSIEVNKILIL